MKRKRLTPTQKKAVWSTKSSTNAGVGWSTKVRVNDNPNVSVDDEDRPLGYPGPQRNPLNPKI